MFESVEQIAKLETEHYIIPKIFQNRCDIDY